MKKALMLITLAAMGLWTACQQIPEDDVNSRAMTSLSIKATTLPSSEVDGWDSGCDAEYEMNGTQVQSRAEKNRRRLSSRTAAFFYENNQLKNREFSLQSNLLL